MATTGHITMTDFPPRRRFTLLDVALGTLSVSVLPFTRAGRAIAAAVAPSTEPCNGKYVCGHPDCDPYVYNPAKGDAENIADPENPIPAGTAFAHLPAAWSCPYCGAGRDAFRPLT
jgi:rubredoxin